MDMKEAEKDRHERIKAVIFDLDNTLCDFVEAKTQACKAVSTHLCSGDGKELLDYFFRGKYDIENPENIRDYLVDEGFNGEDVYTECVDIYRKTKLENIRSYEGVTETLCTLRRRGLKIAVLTDANTEDAEARLHRLNIRKYVDVLVTYDCTGRKKPHHEPFLFTLNRLTLLPREVAMVGDSPVRDMAPGRDVGLFTIYARYGDRNFHEDPERIFDSVVTSFQQIPEVLGLEQNI